MGELEEKRVMMLVHIVGGLGNQMFQYAFAYSVSQRTNMPAKIDTGAFESYELRQYELDRYFIDVGVATADEVYRLKYQSDCLLGKFIRKLTKQPKPLAKSYYREFFFQFDDRVFNQSTDVFFDGYWQSEKYFLDYREDLLKQFILKESIDSKSKYYEQEINIKESVSLHIRRGDYVDNERTNSVHGVCSLDYYERAVELVSNRLDKPHFFVFSDDLEWAKANMDFIEKVTFVQLGKTVPDHEEMYLMSQCKHHIIANSSFSWWGAWLNKNPAKIVVAPKRWFKDKSINTSDLIPDAWIRL